MANIVKMVEAIEVIKRRSGALSKTIWILSMEERNRKQVKSRGICYSCGDKWHGSVKHKEKFCKAHSLKCKIYGVIGHFPSCKKAAQIWLKGMRMRM